MIDSEKIRFYTSANGVIRVELSFARVATESAIVTNALMITDIRGSLRTRARHKENEYTIPDGIVVDLFSIKNARPWPTQYQQHSYALSIHTSRMTLADDVNLEEFVMTKDEFSGADIKAICTEAGLLALREHRMKFSNYTVGSTRNLNMNISTYGIHRHKKLIVNNISTYT
ncbi:hypothetical protein TSUD_284290 [Trifolium subterraneum]|uniref:AAA ATPase AAA+ lid domain-containing protein n=1 Tax=Trifolium subterraneum TaxID=3900 RepID=A0A2Z6NW65_TRISU|nr:hypothetical protein TSUD_284290 [Trifolium subterraneum]